MRYVLDTDRLLTLLLHHQILIPVDESGVAVEVQVKEKGSWDYKKVGYTKEFEEWWRVYPRKEKKPEAFRAWMQVEEVRPSTDVMMRQTQAYAKHCVVEKTEKRFIPHPATWLRDYRWEDHYVGATSRPPAAENGFIRVARRLQAEAEDYRDHPDWASYRRKVTAGLIKPGFKEYIGEG